jgi:quinol-cytochrome oxidoreductase complex cytochrome b subunit
VIARWLSWGRLAVTAAVLLSVLLVTGLYLTFRYRPSGAFYGPRGDEGRGFTLDAAVLVHQIAAYALLAVVLVASFLVVFRFRRSPLAQRATTALAATFLPVVSVAAIASGVLLPWDRLAVSAVTTGSGAPIRGVLDFSLPVRDLLIGSHQVAPSSYARAVWIHILVIPVVLVAAAALLAWSVRRPGTRGDAEPASAIVAA